MKLRDFLTHVHLHPILILLVFTAILTGAFIELLILFAIVTIHEWGHFRMAKFFHWRIKKVTLWLFGGTMESEEHGSRPMHEQVYVTLAGPFQHIWMLTLLYSLVILFPEPTTWIRTAISYNWLILAFNLLPIWPLDGGKILFYLLNRFYSYRVSHHLTIIFSAGLLIASILLLTFLSYFTLHGCLLAAFLLLENRLEWKRRYYSFMRYLMHRHGNNEPPGKVVTRPIEPEETIWNVLSRIRNDRQQRYFLKGRKGNVWIREEDCLEYFFTHGNPHLPIRELAQIYK
ncbi:stage IV sporulation protein FB [Thalassobacillus devorans]|nr:site-2 protease family protein [Thalassobacillus devorans]NIK29794.1 stage IV sporulation protein FB [Thalassobacillus devorans]